MSLTDSDREYLDHLISSRTGDVKSDMRWVKLIAGFALTVFGGALTVLYPIASGIHNDIEKIKHKIDRYESDHLKCHRWEWPPRKGDKQ